MFRRSKLIIFSWDRGPIHTRGHHKEILSRGILLHRFYRERKKLSRYYDCDSTLLSKQKAIFTGFQNSMIFPGDWVVLWAVSLDKRETKQWGLTNTPASEYKLMCPFVPNKVAQPGPWPRLGKTTPRVILYHVEIIKVLICWTVEKNEYRYLSPHEKACWLWRETRESVILQVI